MSEIEAAEEEFTETATKPKGKLRISLPMLGEPLARFQRDRPEIELERHVAPKLKAFIDNIGVHLRLDA